MNDIEEIKSRLNIVDIVKEFVDLKKSGNNYFGLCPFHNEKTPSFSVNEKLQIFKCFGCGEGGDVFKFYMKINGLNFQECLIELAGKVGYKFKFNSIDKQNFKYLSTQRRFFEINALAKEFFTNNILEILSNTNTQKKKYYSIVKDYIKKRGLDDINLINVFGIGFDDGDVNKLLNFFKKYNYTQNDLIDVGLLINKDNTLFTKFRYRIVFSIFDHLGKCVGFSGRYIFESNGKKQLTPPKYINTSDNIVFNKSKLLFGLYQAQQYIDKNNKFLILCEGQMNVVSSFKIGIKNTVASLGTSLTEQQIELISRYVNTVYLAFDKDKAGNKALVRALNMFMKKNNINVKILNWDKSLGKDPDELIKKDKKLWIDSVNNPFIPFDYFLFHFENLKNKNDPDVVNRFLNFIIPLVNMYKNPILKQDIYKQISFKFGIDIDTIYNYIDDNQNDKNLETKDNFNFNYINVNNSNNDFYNLNMFYFALLLQYWDELKVNLKNISIDKKVFHPDFIIIFDFLHLYIDFNLENLIENLKLLDSNLYQKVHELLSYPLINFNIKYISVKILEKIYKNIAYAKYRCILKEYNTTQDKNLLEEAKKLAKIFT